MIYMVRLSPKVKKQLKRVPQHVVKKLMAWIGSVELSGLEEIRKVKGFHDEPLKGPLKGKRSIRLSRGYRAIYIIDTEDWIEIVEVEEINKHEY